MGSLIKHIKEVHSVFAELSHKSITFFFCSNVFLTLCVLSKIELIPDCALRKWQRVNDLLAFNMSEIMASR